MNRFVEKICDDTAADLWTKRLTNAGGDHEEMLLSCRLVSEELRYQFGRRNWPIQRVEVRISVDGKSSLIIDVIVNGRPGSKRYELPVREAAVSA